MESNILWTESFGFGTKRNYFLDFKHTITNSKFIQITRSDQCKDGSYQRSNVIVFEEDFHFFIEAMSSLLHHASYLEDITPTRNSICKPNLIKAYG